MLDTINSDDVVGVMSDIGNRAKQAAKILTTASTEQKNTALLAMADALVANTDLILEANAKDMEAAEKSGMASAFLDRLRLDKDRVAAMAEGLRDIVELSDPVGGIIAEWDRPNGLKIQRVRTPLGVIGVIFESRPNVTADAGALCLKSGNAVILRGGSDSFHSSRSIHKLMVEGLNRAGLPENAIQIVYRARGMK